MSKSAGFCVMALAGFLVLACGGDGYNPVTDVVVTEEPDPEPELPLTITVWFVGLELAECDWDCDNMNVGGPGEFNGEYWMQGPGQEPERLYTLDKQMGGPGWYDCGAAPKIARTYTIAPGERIRVFSKNTYEHDGLSANEDLDEFDSFFLYEEAVRIHRGNPGNWFPCSVSGRSGTVPNFVGRGHGLDNTCRKDGGIQCQLNVLVCITLPD